MVMPGCCEVCDNLNGAGETECAWCETTLPEPIPRAKPKPAYARAKVPAPTRHLPPPSDPWAAADPLPAPAPAPWAVSVHRPEPVHSSFRSAALAASLALLFVLFALCFAGAHAIAT